MGEVIEVRCIDTFDPKVIRVFVKDGNSNQLFVFDIRDQDYAILEMIPGFPPSPCRK